LDEVIKLFARSIPPTLKIKSIGGEQVGKWIVRVAYEQDLPEEIAWRKRVPIEEGWGTSVLPQFFEEKISDEEFLAKREKHHRDDRVTVRDKEHLYYYEVFRSIFGVPKPTKSNMRTCPACGSGLPENASFCRTCGAWFYPPNNN
jgi:asparagine synthase (glutamine-hydrolysing)